MRDFIRRRPVLSFFVLAVAINVLANVLRLADPDLGRKVFGTMQTRNLKGDMISGVQLVLEFPLAWTYFLSPAAPTIAALIVVLAQGRDALATWASRFKPWRGMDWRQGLGVWLLAFCAFFALIAVILVLMLSTGADEAAHRAIAVYGGSAAAVLASLFYGMFLSVGPLLEEMGWRGFLQPIMLKRHSPLIASVIVGTLWACWHLPRDIPAFLSGDGAVVLATALKFSTFLLGTIAGSIIATFLYFKLGGSAWGGIIAHAIHNETAVNFMGGWDIPIRVGPFQDDILLLIECAAALTLLLVVGPRLGAPKSEEEPALGGSTNVAVA